MALTDKLTAIADAVREKTGRTAPLTLDQMAAEITGIKTVSDGYECIRRRPGGFPPNTLAPE